MQIRPQLVTVMVRSCSGYSSLAQARVGPRRGPVELGRVLHADRLVRPLLVVQVDNRTPILPTLVSFSTAGTAGMGDQYTFSEP